MKWEKEVRDCNDCNKKCDQQPPTGKRDKNDGCDDCNKGCDEKCNHDDDCNCNE